MSNIIGIDVGKMSLDCAWLRDLDQDKPKRKKVENSPQGFKSMLTWAQDVSGLAANELRFVVEPTGIYHEFLVQFLNQHQATIYLVNPSMVRKFAAGMGILSKNDLIDADMLTRYGLLNRKLQPYQPEAQEISDLKSLLNRLDTLERDLRRELNRQEKVSRAIQYYTSLGEAIDARRTVRYLETEIKRFKKHIGEAIKSTASLQKDYELLLTIPGIGARTAWAMLVTLRSRRFASANQAPSDDRAAQRALGKIIVHRHRGPEVASYLGLNPIEKQLQDSASCRSLSGTTRYRRPRLSKAGNGRYRQALYFPAMVATRKNPDIKAQYDRLLAADKTKMCALGAAMRKLVHICYGVLKHQRPYEVQVQS